MVERFVSAQPFYLHSVSCLRDLADGLIGVGVLPAQLRGTIQMGHSAPNPLFCPWVCKGNFARPCVSMLTGSADTRMMSETSGAERKSQAQRLSCEMRMLSGAFQMHSGHNRPLLG